MKELWTGLVEVLTPPTGIGDTKAFTHVVTWARNSQEFRDQVESVFEEYGWSLIGVEECSPVPAHESLDDEMSEVVARAKGNPKACIYTTFYYYPSKLVQAPA
jgi:hypothetical protein